MSSENVNRCIFIGLPESGKSSFIGALWHVIESGEIESVYSVKVQPDDREYLNKLRTSFLSCKKVGRTTTDFVKNLSLDMKENATGHTASFVFPDLSGETYESQFAYRKLTLDFIDQISECSSIMLFINPDFVNKGHLISDLEGMFEDNEGGLTEKESEVQDGSTEPVEIVVAPEIKWTPKSCQTQVKLVDLLQIIATRIKPLCKINIIISAWDTIKNTPDAVISDITPDQWFCGEVPLLFQYLTANQEKFNLKVFGVSAQGGAYSENEDENYQLQSKLKPSERIIVQYGEQTTHDITLPLKWLFE